MPLNYSYYRVKYLKWDRLQNFIVAWLKAFWKSFVFIVVCHNLKKKKSVQLFWSVMCLPLTSGNIFFYCLQDDRNHNCCIEKVGNKAQFPACTRDLLTELKELSGSLKQYQMFRNMCLSFWQRLPKVQLMQQVFSFISSLNKFNQNSFFPCLRKLLFDLWAQTCGGDGDFGSHASFLSIWGAELDVGLSQGFHMSAQHWGGTSPTNSQQTFTNTTAEPWNRMIYMQGVLCFMANIQNHDMLLF